MRVCLCECVYASRSLLVQQESIRTDSLSVGIFLWAQNKRVHKQLILNIQICWLLFCRFFSFLRSYVYASHEWVCVCHRWLHLNWIKSTIWKSSDSCCMIWGGIPLSSIFSSHVVALQWSRYRCHLLIRFICSSNFPSSHEWTSWNNIHTFLSLALSRFFLTLYPMMLMLVLTPLLLLSLFVIFRSPFFSFRVLTLLQCPLLYTSTTDCFHRSFVCYLFPFFGFLHSLSFNAPFKSAYFYASFFLRSHVNRFFAVPKQIVEPVGNTARQHPGRSPHWGCASVGAASACVHFHKSLLNGLLHCNMTATSGLS